MTSEHENEQWSTERRLAARGLLENLDVSPDLLDREPVAVLRFIDRQLAEVDTSDAAGDQLFQLASDVMSLVAEVIRVLHGAQWRTFPDAPVAERYVLAGGALNRPAHIGSISLENFRARNPSAVAILNAAELEAGLRQTVSDDLLPASPQFQQDPALPRLTVVQGARLRGLVRDAFDAVGRPAVVYSAEAVVDAAHRMSLTDLVPRLTARGGDEAAWRDPVADHITALVRSWDLRVDSLSAAAVRSRVYPRIVPLDTAEPNPYGYARVVAPGLAEILALDLPDSVKMLQDTDVQQLGDLAELRRTALENLGALPIEEHEAVGGSGGVSFDLVSGESPFTASRVLGIPDLLRRLGRTGPGAHGVLVAFPHRHQLALHVISGPEVVPTCNAMLSFAVSAASQAPGRISPHVYWWHQGVLTQLSHQDGDALRINVSPEFRELLEIVVRGRRG